MKKKIKGTVINNIQGNSYEYFRWGKEINFFKKDSILDENDITQLNQKFDRFYKFIIENIFDQQSIDVLKNFKQFLREHYFQFIWDDVVNRPSMRQVGSNKVVSIRELLKDKQFRKECLRQAVDKFFFSADVLFAFVIGDQGKLSSLIERLNELESKNIRHKLTPEEKEQFFKIIDIVLNGYGVSYAIRTVERMEKYKNSDLNKLFSNFRKNYKTEVIDYVKENSTKSDYYIARLYEHLGEF